MLTCTKINLWSALVSISDKKITLYLRFNDILETHALGLWVCEKEINAIEIKHNIINMRRMGQLDGFYCSPFSFLYVQYTLRTFKNKAQFSRVSISVGANGGL